MAKGKSANSVKKQTSISVKRKAPNTEEQRPSPAVKKSVALGAQAVISSEEIGRVAGDVWGVLVRDGGQSLSSIKKAVDAPADVVAAAIGWLAREDKLEFTTKGRQVTISLR